MGRDHHAALKDHVHHASDGLLACYAGPGVVSHLERMPDRQGDFWDADDVAARLR